SYGAPSPSSSSIPHYPFMYPFNYPLNNNSNQEPTSYLQMQPPMSMSSTDKNYMNPLMPITQDVEQY
ncbi:unnamed protein product, partial [Rotaria magnacalcarata]